MERVWLLLGLGLVGCAHTSGAPKWAAEAQPYKEVDIRLFFAPDEPTIIELLEARDRLASRLAASLYPTRDEVRSVLLSPVDADRAAAMVFVVAHKWSDTDLMNAIIIQYNSSAGFLTRYYAIRALLLLESGRVKRLSSRIVHLMIKDNDERIRYSWLPLMSSMEPRDALSALSEYMRTGSPLLQRGAYAVASALGPDFLPRVRDELERANARDALQVLDLLQAGVGRAPANSNSNTP